jgi:pimeloyl-ACP methyl ester carboxylesterase
MHGKAHVVGLSLGGSIAITILGKAPEIVDHAIVDGAGVLPLPGLPLLKIGIRMIQPFLHTNYVIRKIADSIKIHEDDYEEFKQEMLLMSPKSFTRSFLQALAVRQPEGLETTSCPVLFVSGEKEPNAVKRSNILLAKLMRNGQSRIVPGSGHGWVGEKSDLHLRMVQAWINDQPLPQELITIHQVRL